jgi:hypothetical protein
MTIQERSSFANQPQPDAFLVSEKKPGDVELKVLLMNSIDLPGRVNKGGMVLGWIGAIPEYNGHT